MTFKVLKQLGRHAKDSLVYATDFPEGRVQELVASGVLTPHDGEYTIPVSDDDASGWKRRCKALEDDNLKLRTAVGGPAQLARISELEAELAVVKGNLSTANMTISDYQKGSVTKEDHQNLQDKFKQLEILHKSTVDELKKAKAK